MHLRRHVAQRGYFADPVMLFEGDRAAGFGESGHGVSARSLPRQHPVAFHAAVQQKSTRLRDQSLAAAKVSVMLVASIRARGRARGSHQGETVVVGIDSIIVMIIVGAIAGWLAGQLVRGFGFGLLWNIIIGIVGAFIGVWLLTQLGFVPFSGFVGSIVNSVIGAVILLIIAGFIRR
jgi:uncharacterized membrane protein YeaQ/YmgE (transglycosylase-associated protein family)